MSSMRKLIDAVSTPAKVLNESVLSEDLGSLEAIDKKFINGFKTYNNKKLDTGLTSDSPVSTEEVSTAVGVANLFNDKDVYGLVAVVDGVQIFSAIKKTSRKYSYSSGNTEFDMNYAWSTMKEIGIVSPDEDRYSSTWNHHVKENKLKAVFSKILKAAKEQGKKVSTIIVKIDRSKDELRKARASARSGSIFFEKDVRRKLAMDLRSRLDKFKASKAQGVDSIEAAFEQFKTKFLDKISIGGYTYGISRTNLNWDSLTSEKEDTWSNSYITYEIDASGKEKVEAERTAWRKANPEFKYGSDEYEEFSKSLPPREFEIMVKLKGNVLTPTKLTIKDSYYY